MEIPIPMASSPSRCKNISWSVDFWLHFRDIDRVVDPRVATWEMTHRITICILLIFSFCCCCFFTNLFVVSIARIELLLVWSWLIRSAFLLKALTDWTARLMWNEKLFCFPQKLWISIFVSLFQFPSLNSIHSTDVWSVFVTTHVHWTSCDVLIWHHYRTVSDSKLAAKHDINL